MWYGEVVLRDGIVRFAAACDSNSIETRRLSLRFPWISPEWSLLVDFPIEVPWIIPPVWSHVLRYCPDLFCNVLLERCVTMRQPLLTTWRLRTHGSRFCELDWRCGWLHLRRTRDCLTSAYRDVNVCIRVSVNGSLIVGLPHITYPFDAATSFFSSRVSWLAVSRQAVPLCSCCFFFYSSIRHWGFIRLASYSSLSLCAVCCYLQLPAICFTSLIYNFLGNRTIFNKERSPGDQRQSRQDWLREFGEA